MIINGVSVGPYELGWGLQELKEKISISGFVEEELDNHYTITTNTLKFWVEKEQGEITQITVFGEYEGKFLGGRVISTNRVYFNLLFVTIVDLEGLPSRSILYPTQCRINRAVSGLHYWSQVKEWI
ncbi:hypothetical protein PC41400_08985 [Paenibacillus chitinolyticus]|uniref:Uncharacterized protein n=1 Tax=Paenibacillus chitinolyticus TaxID=79263 RepID=A0A410WTT6_9BACL|nr:hypothetical protein [Paenibacillus chitinolyticus]MCY9591347.1 hypothetical protein [Paenibacillus chitinolyticus]MCY9597408.1 hypothetical protein [Paenibacillus chitinolyticus]QAV17788.1 hypothetical protein PC41400_08985 [Paenibacillus chitinolyticus]